MASIYKNGIKYSGENSSADMSNYYTKTEVDNLIPTAISDELLEIIESDHSYAGITSTTETDMNNLTTKGRYSIDNSNGNKTNCPNGVTRFILDVSVHTRYIVQIAIGIYVSTTGSSTTAPKPSVFVRSKDTIIGTWSAWELPNSANTSTVNGHTVESDVPADAKFTDTTNFLPLAGGTMDKNASIKIPSANLAGGITLKDDTGYTTTITSDCLHVMDEEGNASVVGGSSIYSSKFVGDLQGKVNGHTINADVPSDAKFTDTTYSNFVKSGSGAKAGLVPAPSTTAGTTKYLREDGTWSVPPSNNTTYSVATQTTDGLMSASDKKKLDEGTFNHITGVSAEIGWFDGNTTFDGDMQVTGVVNAADGFSGNLEGTADKAKALEVSEAIGSATKPVYINASGVPTATTYTLGKSVPSTAVFTDTKNTAGSTNSTSKLFLVGATSQATNPQTYSRSDTYVNADGTFISPAANFGGSLVTIGGNGIGVDGEVAAYSFYPPDKSFTTSLGLGSSSSFDEGYIDKIHSKYLNFIYFTNFTDLTNKLKALPSVVSVNYGKRGYPIYYPICTNPGDGYTPIDIGVLNANTTDIHYCGIILDFAFCPIIYGQGNSDTAFIKMENTIIRNLRLNYKDNVDALPTTAVSHKKIYLYGASFNGRPCSGLENCDITMQIYHSNNISSNIPYHKGIEIAGSAKIDNCIIYITGLASTLKYHTYVFGIEATRQYPLIMTNNYIYFKTGTVSGGGSTMYGSINIKSHATNAPLIYNNNICSGSTTGYINTSTASSSSAQSQINADYRVN